MNDTSVEDVLVPTGLVLGIIPTFPIISTDIPTQTESKGILAAVKAEMNAIIAERNILTALTRNIPPTADRV